MASNQSKKKVAGARNSDRRNGKAWKKDKNKSREMKPVTPERLQKDLEIKRRREERRIAGMARHQAELQAQEEARLAEEAKKALEAHLAEQERLAKIEANKKPHVPSQKLEYVAA